MKTSAVILCLGALTATAAAGHIGCISGSLNGGRGNVPTHNTQYQIYPQDEYYVCDVQNEACGEIADNPSSFENQFVSCSGNAGSTQQAAMSISYDSGSKQYTFNINVQGEGQYSCTSGGTDGCDFSS